MVSITMELLSGQYHATPWGRHVNEGVPEWPPSPYRFFRALMASWHHNHPEIKAEDAGAIFTKLSFPPSMYLPQASVGHTRHYMPQFGKNDKALVFDSFIVVKKGDKIWLSWDNVSLTDEEKEILDKLLNGVTYLGRAESWCHCSLTEEEPPEINCRPLDRGSGVENNKEVVRVMNLLPDAPEKVIEALNAETGILRSKRRILDPPGTQWINYMRDPLVIQPVTKRLQPAGEKIVAARFTLDRRPLPRVEETLILGENTRISAMGQYGKLKNNESSPTLSGRSESGPRKGHRHAFYLPSDEDGDGRIDHLTVYAPEGLGEDEMRALGNLREIKWEDSADEGRRLKVLLLGFLRPQDLTEDKNKYFAKKWISCSPFILTRYPKTTNNGTPKLNSYGEQLDGPEDQIRKEWEERQKHDPNLPGIKSIKRSKQSSKLQLKSGKTIRWLAFNRNKSKGHGTSSGFAYGLELEFEEPVPGPLAFGYACHFGLGQFKPVYEEKLKHALV